MSNRPTIRRTYGKSSRPQQSCSLIFAPDDGNEALQSSPHASSSKNLQQTSTPSLFHADCSSSPSRLFTPPTSPTLMPADDTLPSSPSARPAIENEAEIQLATSSLKGKTKAGSSVQGTLQGFFTVQPKRKRPLAPSHTVQSPSSTGSFQNPSTSSIAAPKALNGRTVATNNGSVNAPARESLKQMHLTHLPLLHTCKECSMSYVRGGGEDESLHAKHHMRVVKGIPWEGLGRSSLSANLGKGKEKDTGFRVIRENADFGSQGGKGKIIMCDGSWGGSKLNEISDMVDTVLSAPALPPAILERCKIFLFVTSSPSPTMKRQKVLGEKKMRDRVVAVVVAQPIKVAMKVLRDGDGEGVAEGAVDTGGVVCDPTPLPTPLGIHRLFTIPSYRSLSLANYLLDTACHHAIYGMSVSPLKGQVAFSQPTDSGKKVMEKWGQGHVRVFVDDERQL